MAIRRRGPGLSFDAADRVIRRKVEQFVHGATGFAATEAMTMTPREYGFLANSQYTNVVNYPNLVTGTVGYGATYAKYLNGIPGGPTPNWLPRRVEDKQGPSANMSAEPGFLTKAFESSENQAEINRMAERILSV